MIVELNKDDLVTLVMGCNLNSKLTTKYSKLEYGHWTGGFVDEWTWYEWVLEDLSEEELYNIYKECKSYETSN